MKYLLTKLSFILICSIIFLNCSKDKGNVAQNYARFITTEAQASAADDSVMIRVEWSQAQWKISTEGSSFITGFSATTGGNERTSSSYTDIKVSLAYNLTSASRSQPIILTNITSGATSQITIVQNTATHVTMTLNPAVTYQKVTGFGGMIDPPGWVGVANQITVAETEKMYSSTGLGYNIIRMMVYPDQANWDTDIAVAKKAQDLGAIVFASPWEPPTNMVGTRASAFDPPNTTKYLLPAYYKDYAAHLKAFVDYTASKGLNLYAISVQNEPDMNWCSFTSAEIFNFVRDYGRKLGNTKTMAAESFHFNPDYTDQLLNSTETVNNFDLVGGHIYGSGLNDYPLARQKGKEMWMTEHLLNEEKNGYDWLWAPSLQYVAKEINDCMVANYNAYIWWYLKRYYSMIADTNTKSTVAVGETTKRGYILSHYAKYATGRTRIGTTVPDADLLSTAYAGTNDMTMVIINNKSTPVILQVASPSAISTASAVETNATKNMESITTTLSSDKKSVNLVLTAKSIVSVKLLLQ
jgi:glucuronoarabinoxylan endo-1,4-beta-xylanase